MESLFAGKQQTAATKLAEFCAHALLTLEVLIHPRALPLVDYTYEDNNSFGEDHSSLQHEHFGRSNSTPHGLPQVPPDYDDDLCARWLENGQEGDVSMDKDAENNQEPSEACRDNGPEVLPVRVSSYSNIQERTQMDSEAATCAADVEMKTVEEETTFKLDQPGESVMQFQEPGSFTTNIPMVEAHNDRVDDIVPEKILSGSSVPHNEVIHMESDQGSSVNKNFAFASQSNSLWQTTSGPSTIFQEFALLDNSVADEDGFPDIVDGDPDSESE